MLSYKERGEREGGGSNKRCSSNTCGMWLYYKSTGRYVLLVQIYFFANVATQVHRQEEI